MPIGRPSVRACGFKSADGFLRQPTDGSIDDQPGVALMAIVHTVHVVDAGRRQPEHQRRFVTTSVPQRQSLVVCRSEVRNDGHSTCSSPTVSSPATLIWCSGK
jgi:hypothetical protein